MSSITIFTRNWMDEFNQSAKVVFRIAKSLNSSEDKPTFAIADSYGFAKFAFEDMTYTFLKTTIEAATRAIRKIDWGNYPIFTDCPTLKNKEWRIWILACWEMGFNGQVSSEEDDFDTLWNKIKKHKAIQAKI